MVQRTLAQFLEELMSTRLGVRREGEIVSATARTADDGKEYYDVEVRHGGCRQGSEDICCWVTWLT